MRLVVSAQAADLIAEQGGRLYVWLKTDRCCGAVTMLAASCEPPGDKEFCRVTGDGRFELFLPVGLNRRPEELHLEARRFPRRVEAYWDGCAWVS